MGYHGLDGRNSNIHGNLRNAKQRLVRNPVFCGNAATKLLFAIILLILPGCDFESSEAEKHAKKPFNPAARSPVNNYNRLG